MSIYDEDWGEVEAPRRVTLAEQKQTGLVQRNTFVPAATTPRAVSITEAEARVIEGAQNLAHQVIGAPNTSHTRQDDNAISVAWAAVIAAIPYSLVFLVVASFLGIIVIHIDFLDAPETWGLVFIAWGMFSSGVYYMERRQGLYHSAAGVSHHEIDGKENVAITAVMEHNKSLRYKWTLDYVERTGKEPPTIQID